MHDDLTWMDDGLNLRGNDGVPGAAGGTVIHYPPAITPLEAWSGRLVTGLGLAGGVANRFADYIQDLTKALGHANRAAPFRSYCVGLLLRSARTDLEPMPADAAHQLLHATYQSMQHFIAKADWPDDAVLEAVRAHVLPIIAQRGPIRGWMMNDTGIAKQGTQSVGVARQYCGPLGRQENCQIAATLSVANDHASLPIAHRLYLPRAWADHPARRARAGVPNDVTYQTRPQIALAQFAPRSRPVCRARRCWPRQPMVPTMTSAMPSPSLACSMLSVFRRPPACGRQSQSRCRPSPGGTGSACPR